MTREKIKKALDIQKSIEGTTRDTELLLAVLPCIQWASEWKALMTVRHHRYGKASYQVHFFYYPSPLLLRLQNLFTVTV